MSEVMTSGNGGYYDIPMLKPPVWKWEISSYFFLGGLSGAAHVYGRLASRTNAHAEVGRLAALTAAAAFLPCAPLLILDLGDKSRFHHMLRIFKPHSPMSLGTWTITAYSVFVLGDAVAAVLKWRPGMLRNLLDVAGLPLGMMMTAYTGVLLSCTATPLWSHNRWLPALFAAGSFHNAGTAIELSMEIAELTASPQKRERKKQRREASHNAFELLDGLTTVAEAVTIAGYLSEAGDFAEPITEGKMSQVFWLGGVGLGLIAPWLLRGLRVPKKAEPYKKIAGHLMGLAGGLALRWALVYGGHESGNDQMAARRSSAKQNGRHSTRAAGQARAGGAAIEGGAAREVGILIAGVTTHSAHIG
jgi:formate-dependent nitrite reductase membrane component NrfD